MAEKQDDQGATPPAQSLSVVIPSRTQPRQAEFLRRAVQSIKAQTIYSKMTVDIIVSVDRAQLFPAGLADEPGLVAVESHAASQAAALNAAIRNVNTDLIAVLEDDDRWRPRSLELARWALSHAGFASSTRLELNEKNEVVRIKNSPTPSGWLMPVSTMRTVGEFNEGYRWHLDNEWCGWRKARFHASTWWRPPHRSNCATWPGTGCGSPMLSSSAARQSGSPGMMCRFH